MLSNRLTGNGPEVVDWTSNTNRDAEIRPLLPDASWSLMQGQVRHLLTSSQIPGNRPINLTLQRERSYGKVLASWRSMSWQIPEDVISSYAPACLYTG